MPTGFVGPFDGSHLLRELLRFLERADVTSAILWDIIDAHSKRAVEMRKLDLRYRLDPRGVPIMTRQIKNPRKINEKLNHDFYGRIVRTKAGYMASDISTLVDPKRATEGQVSQITEVVRDWNRANSWPTKATKLARHDTMMGEAFTLLFVPTTGSDPAPRCTVLNPWETVVIRDSSTGDVLFGMRYFEVEHVEVGVDRQRSQFGRAPTADHPSPQQHNRKRTVVEWYDQKTVQFWVEEDTGDRGKRGRFVPDVETAPPIENFPAGSRPHQFEGVPIVEWPNNDERIGDAEIPLSLIDAYDRAASDLSSEITQLRLAYMVIKGMGKEINAEFVAELEQTGVFPVSEDGDVKFLTKDLNDEAVQNLLALLKRNIFLMGNSVDFTDEQFKANLPIVAFLLSLKPLEESAQVTENMWQESLREQYRLLAGWWKLSGEIDFDATVLDFVFTRKIPSNSSEEIEQFVQLLGNVSLRTALSRLSFIDDPEQELERIEAEDKADAATVAVDDEELPPAFGDQNGNRNGAAARA